MQFEDVALRNRKQYFNGRDQTGLFLQSTCRLGKHGGISGLG
jgi:hypothetical protein